MTQGPTVILDAGMGGELQGRGAPYGLRVWSGVALCVRAGALSEV
ncbi:homocysteine S-methyltransferase, partial [Pseudomonas syringae pv. tagetis]